MSDLGETRACGGTGQVAHYLHNHMHDPNCLCCVDEAIVDLDA